MSLPIRSLTAECGHRRLRPIKWDNIVLLILIIPLDGTNGDGGVTVTEAAGFIPSSLTKILPHILPLGEFDLAVPLACYQSIE